MVKYKLGHNQYGEYCVPISSNHRPAAQKILSGGIHEPKTIQFIIDSCSGGDVIHAGSYFGDFIPALSSAVDPGCKVWVFEPNPENFICSQITIELNDLRNVEISNVGLSSKNRKAKMMILDEHGKSLGGGSRVVEWVEKINRGGFCQVEIKPLDDLIPPGRKISLIHLDIEGFEKFALDGTREIVERYSPVLVLESVPDLGWLWGMGYGLGENFEGNSVLYFR